MKIQFTFKHMNSSQTLIDVAHEKLSGPLARFSTQPVHLHVTFSVEGLDQRVHVSMVTADGRNIEADHRGEDMYAGLDVVAHRLDTQLRKYKEKLKDHKGGGLRAVMRGSMRTVASGYTETQLDVIEEWNDVSAVNDTTFIDAADVLRMSPLSDRAPLPPVCGAS